MKSLNCLMDLILYQMFKPPAEIYVDRIQNRVTFKVKSWYYLELLMPEIKIIWECWGKKKKKNCGNLRHLENIEIPA